MSETQDSARVAMARAQAVDRAEGQAVWLRSLGGFLGAVVVMVAVTGTPAAGTSGRALAVLAALVAYLAGHLVVTFAEHELPALAVLAVAGALLGGLQTSGGNGVAASAAVFVCIVRRPDRAGLALAAVAAVGQAVATALLRDGANASDIVAELLLCGLLGVVALLVRRSRDGEERVAILLAELEDAREAETQAAAAHERNRIAGDLHDVLAHSLSGAALQLEAARQLARREDTSDALATAVDRATDLVRDGLVDARDAVGALRGTSPGLDDLPVLIERMRRDLDLDVSTRLDPEPVRPEVGLALYRGVQEALTNVARHAPGAPVEVVVAGSRVVVANGPAARPAAPSPGGGHGIGGLRERLAGVGGSAQAGPIDGGWRVVMDVPE